PLKSTAFTNRHFHLWAHHDRRACLAFSCGQNFRLPLRYEIRSETSRNFPAAPALTSVCACVVSFSDRRLSNAATPVPAVTHSFREGRACAVLSLDRVEPIRTALVATRWQSRELHFHYWNNPEHVPSAAILIVCLPRPSALLFGRSRRAVQMPSFGPIGFPHHQRRMGCFE